MGHNLFSLSRNDAQYNFKAKQILESTLSQLEYSEVFERTAFYFPPDEVRVCFSVINNSLENIQNENIRFNISL